MSNQPYYNPPQYPAAGGIPGAYTGVQPPPPSYGYPIQQQTPAPYAYPDTGYPPPATTVDHFTSTAPPPYPTVVQPPQPEKQTFTTEQNVVIVTQQPNSLTYRRVYRPGTDYYMTLSIILTVLCILSCNYCWLLMTIPAIMYSSKAKEANANGDTLRATIYGRISLRLNIAAIVSWIVLWIIVVSASSSVSSGSSGSSYYYSSYYYYNDYYYYNYYYYY